MLLQASYHLEEIVVVRTTSRSIRHQRAVNVVSYSAIYGEGGRLMKAILEFIGKSERLQTVVIEGISVNMHTLELFGRSLLTMQHGTIEST